MEKKLSLRALAENWPSPYVAREEIERFTGGIITCKYIANLDCAGLGPKGRIRVGRKIAYPVTELVSWIEARSSSVN